MPGSMTHKNRPSIDVIIWERFFCVCNIMRGVIFLLSGGGDRSGCTYVIGVISSFIFNINEPVYFNFLDFCSIGFIR